MEERREEKYIINGVEYSRLEDVPEQYRALVQEALSKSGEDPRPRKIVKKEIRISLTGKEAGPGSTEGGLAPGKGSPPVVSGRTIRVDLSKPKLIFQSLWRIAFFRRACWVLGLALLWLDLEGAFLGGSYLLPPLRRAVVLGEPFKFQVMHSGARHAITLSNYFCSLQYEVKAPDGRLIYGFEEKIPRVRRRIYFTPEAAGEYTLLVKRKKIPVLHIPYVLYKPLASDRRELPVMIVEGDRRSLWPIVYWIYSSYIEPWGKYL